MGSCLLGSVHLQDKVSRPSYFMILIVGNRIFILKHITMTLSASFLTD